MPGKNDRKGKHSIKRIAYSLHGAKPEGPKQAVIQGKAKNGREASIILKIQTCTRMNPNYHTEKNDFASAATVWAAKLLSRDQYKLSSADQGIFDFRLSCCKRGGKPFAVGHWRVPLSAVHIAMEVGGQVAPDGSKFYVTPWKWAAPLPTPYDGGCHIEWHARSKEELAEISAATKAAAAATRGPVKQPPPQCP